MESNKKICPLSPKLECNECKLGREVARDDGITTECNMVLFAKAILEAHKRGDGVVCFDGLTLKLTPDVKKAES